MAKLVSGGPKPQAGSKSRPCASNAGANRVKGGVKITRGSQSTPKHRSGK